MNGLTQRKCWDHRRHVVLQVATQKVLEWSQVSFYESCTWQGSVILNPSVPKITLDREATGSFYNFESTA